MHISYDSYVYHGETLSLNSRAKGIVKCLIILTAIKDILDETKDNMFYQILSLKSLKR